MRTKGKILLVDDEPVFREAIRMKLLNEGFEVMVAEDGEQALKILGRHDFRLIISDIVMPFISGLDLIQHIRSKNITTPLLIVSAMEGPYFEGKARHLGASDYLSKPLQYPALKKKIVRLIES